MSATLKLYRFALSGHCHRVELFLSLLAQPCEMIDVDLRKGEQKQTAFLEMNRFGQVPVLQDGNVILSDSNAILVYLAKRYGRSGRINWLPEDPIGAADVQRWLSVAAGPVAFGPARARLKTVFNAPVDAADAIQRAEALLGVMDKELEQRIFLAGNAPTIADVACYTYIAHAPEGRVELFQYPAVRAWLARIEALPGFVAMRATPLSVAA